MTQLSIRDRIGSSLFHLAAKHATYRRRANGDLQYDGERPGPGWIGHGYFRTSPVMLRDGRPQATVVWKHRWRLAGTNITCHSRPPDLSGSFRCCTLLVAVKLWAWLDGGRGLRTCEEKLPHLQGIYCCRTVHRWLHRLLPFAQQIEQASRLAVINRCESQPLERLFPAGLSPPEKLRRRRWLDGSSVSRLWTALALLFGASDVFNRPLATLLAETRKRFDALKNRP